MHRLICTIIVRIWQKQFFSWSGSYCLHYCTADLIVQLIKSIIGMLHVFWKFRGSNKIWSGFGERGGSVVECRTPEREVRGSRPTAAVLCPWARHFTPRKYWLITQEAMAPSRHDWKIVDWDVKPQHNQMIWIWFKIVKSVLGKMFIWCPTWCQTSLRVW